MRRPCGFAGARRLSGSCLSGARLSGACLSGAGGAAAC
ncbi:pentapeptide repeat-containing protein [Streptomyces sp. NBC_01306]